MSERRRSSTSVSCIDLNFLTEADQISSSLCTSSPSTTKFMVRFTMICNVWNCYKIELLIKTLQKILTLICMQKWGKKREIIKSDRETFTKTAFCTLLIISVLFFAIISYDISIVLVVKWAFSLEKFVLCCWLLK